VTTSRPRRSWRRRYIDAVGEPAEDGVPEPLQFALNGGLRLMLIPTGGFGWVIGEHEVAQRGQSECILSLPLPAKADVHQVIKQARGAGATILAEPSEQPWGYSAAFTDPDGHIWQVSTDAG
jgi:uncharacterized protein